MPLAGLATPPAPLWGAALARPRTRYWGPGWTKQKWGLAPWCSIGESVLGRNAVVREGLRLGVWPPAPRASRTHVAATTQQIPAVCAQRAQSDQGPSVSSSSAPVARPTQSLEHTPPSGNPIIGVP